jgi:hypothetical protein
MLALHVRVPRTAPARAWFAYLRLYGPLETHFDASWPLPDIEEVQ